MDGVTTKLEVTKQVYNNMLHDIMLLEIRVRATESWILQSPDIKTTTQLENQLQESKDRLKDAKLHSRIAMDMILELSKDDDEGTEPAKNS